MYNVLPVGVQTLELNTFKINCLGSFLFLYVTTFVTTYSKFTYTPPVT